MVILSGDQLYSMDLRQMLQTHRDSGADATVAVIPVGLNSYGHPTPQTTTALASSVPRVYRTDRDGTVRVDVRGGTMAVTTAAG